MLNNLEKELAKFSLEQEKAILKELEKQYKTALNEIDDKIAQLMGRTDTENLQSIIYQLDYQNALKGQVGAILDNMKGNQYTTIQDYLKNCYEDGFVGTMYDLQGQGIPLIMPIDQKQMVKAIMNDTKLSEGLYKSLGQNINGLKTNIKSAVSRGMSNSYSYSQIAREIQILGDSSKNKAFRIARTEGHRISQEAAYDAQTEAKNAGAEIVKQWDAALDKRTRRAHAELDGQIREIDEPFEIQGQKAMFPGGFGNPGLDINCRCVMTQRATWDLDENDSFTKWDGVNKELLTIKNKNYGQFKKSYQKMIDDNLTINDVTNNLLNKAKAAEPRITKDLQSILKDTHGTIDYDVGGGKTSLDFKLKGGNSLKRKITSDFVQGVDLDYIEDHIYDNVRYTDLTKGDFLVDDYIKVQQELTDKGYKIARVKNTLGDVNSAYRGLNTVVESPDGYKFELQFHTPEGIDIKERVHKLYELQRVDGISFDEYKRLDNEMLKISQTLPEIKNADAIKSYNTFKGEAQAISIDTRIKMTEANIADVNLRITNDKTLFDDSIKAAQESNRWGAAVDIHSIDELKEFKTIISADNMAGVAIKPDGNITAVFKNSNSQVKGVVNDLIITARENGGVKMDCYGKGLVNMYEKCGYMPVAKIPFNADYVSDPFLLEQRPDVYVLMKTSDTTEKVIEKLSNKSYLLSTQADLDNLPMFDDYDEALQYRDELLKGDK